MKNKSALKHIMILEKRVERWTDKIDNDPDSSLSKARLQVISSLISEIQIIIPVEKLQEYAEFFAVLNNSIKEYIDPEKQGNNIGVICESLRLLNECLSLIQKDMINTDDGRNSENQFTGSKPLVSILIPTYERPDLLTLAIESAINQTYDNIEIIVSDNGPGYDTENVMRDYEAMHDNVHYYHIKGSVDDNWDSCWNHMSEDAEYINFLMDDDLFAPEKIEKMMSYFLEYDNITLVTSYRRNIDIDGRVLPDQDYNESFVKHTALINGESVGAVILHECGNRIGEPTTVLFKRKAAEGRWKGWSGNERYHIADYPLWLRLLEHGDMVYVTEPLSFFRKHEGNGSFDEKTGIRAAINMACEIQTAWNRKVFLSESSDCIDSIVAWFIQFLSLVRICVDHENGDTEYDQLRADLLVVYKEFCRLYIEKNPGEICFEFKDLE